MKNPLVSYWRRDYLVPAGFVVLFAFIGVIVLVISHAATPYAAIEAESGATSGVTVPSDANASGGKYIQFGTQSTTSSGYTVVGNTIENSSGQAVMVHGVDRDTMEWSCDGTAANGGDNGSITGNIPASDFATMRNNWNANAVRIALDQDFWLNGAARYCSSYASNVATVVKEAEANNLIVILDLHWSDAGNLGNGNPGQQCMADQNSITFWQQVAAAYKNDPNVWFELYNEPEGISWNVWQNGGSCGGFQAAGMAQLYNAVRGTGAKNIVIAGGIDYASHLDGVPVPIVSGETNVVYAIHPYANDIDGGDAGAWSDSDWNTRFGYLVQNNEAPVIATEFGDTECGLSSGAASYDNGILSYFKANKIGFTAWAWYVGGCNYPSLITNEAGDCVNSMGCTIQQDMKSYP